MNDEPSKEATKPPRQSKRSLTWEHIENNLIRYLPNKKYYVQSKLKGVRVRECLNTTNLREAQKAKSAWIAEHHERDASAGTGATMGSLIERWIAQVEANGTIVTRTKAYKLSILEMIKKLWPDIEKLEARQLKKSDIENWKNRTLTPDDLGDDAANMRELAKQLKKAGRSPKANPAVQKTACATRINGAITVLRELFALAEARGILRGKSPMDGIKFARVGIKPFKLPTADQMKAVRESVWQSSYDAGILFDVLSETGSRISTARAIRWEHIDWERNTIYYLTVKWKKKGYSGPMSARLRETLLAAKPSNPTGRVCAINACRKPLETACRNLGIAPILSHHDLRHWFVTRCIEKSVDIPTISRWIGHVDGGVLLLKTYGHLRDEHSQAMAKLL